MATYQALYRKYRPQTFDDVSGQLAVTQTLKPCLSLYRFPGYRQDQLRQDSGKSGELPASG